MVRLKDLENWWTPRQVQSYTGYSRQGILEFAKEGKIRAAFVGLAHKEHGRGIWVYDPESVEEFVKVRGIKDKVEVAAEDRAEYGKKQR